MIENLFDKKISMLKNRQQPTPSPELLQDRRAKEEEESIKETIKKQI